MTLAKKSRQRRALSLAFAAATLVAVATFQNCGLLPGYDGFSSSLASDDGGAAEYLSSASIAWSSRERAPNVGDFSRVSRWMDVGGKGLFLYPPVRPGSQALNMDLSARVSAVGGWPWARLERSSSLSPAVTDVEEFSSDRYTVVMVVRDVSLPPANDSDYAGQSTRLFGLYPLDGGDSGYFVLDANVAPNGKAFFQAVSWWGGQTHGIRQSTANVTPTQAASGGPWAIAARFGNDGSDVQMAINGSLSENSAIKVGSPPRLVKVARAFQLHAPELTYGAGGSFAFGEFLLFKRAASDAELKAMSATFSCRWGGPGCASRGYVPPPTDGGDGGPTPTPGQTLYQANCSANACHGPLSSTRIPADKRTLNALNSAILNVSVMSSLGGLSASDRQAIVNALQSL